MAIADDWTVDKKNKLVTHTSGATVYTVNELYTYLSDLSDDIDFMSYGTPMRASTPDIYLWTYEWKMADETSYNFLKSGSLQDAFNGDKYVNVQTIGTITAGTNIFMYRTDGTYIIPWWGTDHIDVLLKVQESNVLISDGIFDIFVREFGDEYDVFQLDASTKSINTVALSSANDFSNNTDEGTIGAIGDVTLTFGAIQRDLNNGNGLKNYELEIDCNFRPLNEVFEYTKYLTRVGETTLINGTPGERFLSLDPSYSINKKSPFGTFVGGTWYTSRGIWLKNYTIAEEEAFELIDSDNATQSPPLNIGFSLTGLQTGSRIVIYNTDVHGIVAEVENSSTTFSHRYTYEEDINIRVVIMHKDWKYQEIITTLTNSDTSLPINQIEDPLYEDDVI